VGAVWIDLTKAVEKGAKVIFLGESGATTT